MSYKNADFSICLTQFIAYDKFNYSNNIVLFEQNTASLKIKLPGQLLCILKGYLLKNF